MNTFLKQLRSQTRTWTVTGCAGFIGSNLVEALLKAGQRVIGLDNFCTGFKANLEDVQRSCRPEEWSNFKFIQGDIRSLDDVTGSIEGADFVLHQAALGSVPRSIEDPLSSHQANVDGFVNVLWASKKMNVKGLVYASSSSVYGDSSDLPKREDKIGRPLSPYAATKLVDEIYAQTFFKTYNLPTIGLRYFNVFGPRQSPDGAYAAVIPKWIQSLSRGEGITIFGDGTTSRDFCYVDLAVQANLRAALAPSSAWNQIYNVAVGEQTSLTQLFENIRDQLYFLKPELNGRLKASYAQFRDGDIKHSLADIDLAKRLLGYEPNTNLQQGLKKCIPWYLNQT